MNRLDAIFFDARDHELIRIVHSVYEADARPGYIRKLYYPFFHPLGIKELAESKGLHTAYAIVSLLEFMERGGIENRLAALKALKDEVLETAYGSMPKNTARVLLQIMKELVRAKGNDESQIVLAHAFRLTAFGKPRLTRKLLAHYHLLEMPEAWNQVSFDDHVHDANTSGRKSPTHLIMDAWIKGIRRLRVIYYHYIEPRFALELIEAAKSWRSICASASNSRPSTGADIYPSSGYPGDWRMRNLFCAFLRNPMWPGSWPRANRC